MTWAEFKREVERQGVTDEMTVGWIDVHLPVSILNVAIASVMVGVLTEHPKEITQFQVS